MNDKELIRLELTKELARRNYIDYVDYVHQSKWIKGKHLYLIADEIEKVLSGETTRLILSIPPQHGKSMMITETLPSYYLGKHPDHRVIVASYGEDLAMKFGRRNKQKIQEFGKELFNIELSKSSSSDKEFEIETHKGSMISRGIMSGITGQPAELIIVDDPIKNRLEANSETFRARLKEEWLNSLNTRLSANGRVIIIQTRWHEDDLAGWLQDTEPHKWKVINIPCEAEDNDILGRKKGDALFPEIGKDNEWLQEFKKSYMTAEGSMAWNALFQGRPTSMEGNMIKRSWFNYVDIEPSFNFKLISVDATFKDGDNSDYVAIQVWGKIGTRCYFIDRLKARMDFVDTLTAIRNMQYKHNADLILIEDKANGSAIINMLKQEFMNILAVNPEGGKVARVNAVAPILEAGNVYLLRAEWNNDFIEECASFPNGKHDDEVDAMSQALNKLKSIDAMNHTLTDKEKIAQRKYEEEIEAITGSGYDDLLNY